MKVKFLTIGSDPEFFIRNKKTKKFVPSAYITTGTKKMPQEATKEFFIHKDNLTVEGNIPPAKTKKEFVANMKFIKEFINTLAEIKNCELVSDNVAEFLPRYINSEDGMEYGCAGFTNCWDNRVNRVTAINSNNRFAGFHIHYGFDIKNNYFFHKRAIAKAFDMFITYPSRKIYETPERDNTYGKYGSYRITNYGIECRSLGGFFTQDEYIGWVWDQSIKMFNWLNDKDNYERISGSRINSYISKNIENEIINFIKKNKMEELIFEKKEELINA